MFASCPGWSRPDMCKEKINIKKKNIISPSQASPFERRPNDNINTHGSMLSSIPSSAGPVQSCFIPYDDLLFPSIYACADDNLYLPTTILLNTLFY